MSAGSRAEQKRERSGGWPAVGAVALGAFALITMEFLPVGLLPEIGSSLGVSDGVAGLLVTAPGLAAALSAPVVVVALGDRDRRPVLAWLTLAVVLSAAIGASAHGLAQMLVARLLVGIGIGGFWAIGPGIGMRLVDPARASLASAIVLAGVSVGTVVGLPAGTVVGHLVGWRVAFLLAGGIGLAALAAQLRFLPALASTRIAVGELFNVVRVDAARIGLVLVVLVFVGQFAGYTFITPYLHDQVGIGDGAISMILVAYGSAGVAGNFVFSTLAGPALRRSLVVLVSILGIGAVATVALRSAPLGVCAAVVVWGFAFGGAPLLLQTWMFRSLDRGADGGAALFVSTLQLSVAAGALIGGVFVEAVGVRLVIAVTGLFAAAALLVILRLTAAAPPEPRSLRSPAATA